MKALAAYTGSSTEHASREGVAAFIAGQRVAPSTLRVRISCLAAFYGWLVVTEQRPDDPTRGLRRPRLDRMTAVRPIGPDRMLRLVEGARDARVLALIWVLNHGLRLAEVIGLNVDDVTGDELRVVGKGGKVRTVILEPAASRALGEYLGLRRAGPVFMSARGGRISRRQVERIVARLGDQTGIPGLHPHRLRHSHLTSMAASGSNAFVLAEIAGHADTSTTAHYVKLSGQAIRQEVRRLPLAVRARHQRMTVLEGGDAAGTESLQGDGPDHDAESTPRLRAER